MGQEYLTGLWKSRIIEQLDWQVSRPAPPIGHLPGPVVVLGFGRHQSDLVYVVPRSPGASWSPGRRCD